MPAGTKFGDRRRLPDTRSIGEDFVVGPTGWEQKPEANKNAYMAEFVQRQRFLTAYPLTMTAVTRPGSRN